MRRIGNSLRARRLGPTDRRARRDLGVTLVGYALILGFVVSTSIGAITVLDQSTQGEVANQSVCVSTRPPPPECQSRAVTTTTLAAGGGPGGGGPGGGGPVTTVPVTVTESATTVTTALFVWTVDIEVLVVDDAAAPVESAEVAMIFNAAPLPVASSSCITDATGVCTVSWTGLITVDQVVASVDSVSSALDGGLDVLELAVPLELTIPRA